MSAVEQERHGAIPNQSSTARVGPWALTAVALLVALVAILMILR